MTRTDNERIKAEALRRANELRRQAFDALWDRLVAVLHAQPLLRAQA